MTRRSALALPALGLGRRRREVAMYPDEQGVFFEVVVAGGGVFVYSPVPGFGNLVANIVGTAGTDPFGNAYLAGQVTYGALGGGKVALQNSGGQLVFYTAATEAGPWLPGPSTSLVTLGTGSSNAMELSAVAYEFTATGLTQLTMLFPSGNGAVKDTANVAAILSSGGTPWLMPGIFDLNCGDPTLTSLGPAQYIIGSGDKNTIINAHGSGDLFYWSAPSPNSDGNTTGGGFIGGATIDMSACSGAAVGIHAGDINALRFDCRVQHSTKTGGSWGFLFDNANTFTERMQIQARVKDCGFAGGDGGMVGFQVSGAVTSTASFSRLKGRIELTQGSNQQDGVVVQAGAHIYDYDLEIIGNFQGGASVTTAAALRITGTVPVGHPGAGTHSAISNGRLNIGVECSTGTHTPTTFIQAATSNSITDSYGNINWNQNFTTSGITGAGFKFFGPVQGDTAMGTRLYYGTAPTQTISANGQTISSTVPSAKIPISVNAPGFTGIILSPGDVDGQLIYLIGTGASSMTFAAAGTSNVAQGTGAVLNVNQMMILMWDAASALWYPAT